MADLQSIALGGLPLRDWNYKLDDDTLTVAVRADFTIDLLPAILGDILRENWLDDVEKLRVIEIERILSRNTE